MMARFARGVTAAGLVLVAGACRVTAGGGSGVLADAVNGGEPAPMPAAFAAFCERYPSHTPSERALYEGMLIGSSPNGEGGVGARPCDWMWARLWRKPAVTPLRAVADLAPLAVLSGLPRVTVALTIGEMPQHFDTLRSLDLYELRVKGSASGVSLSGEELAQIVATAAARPNLQVLTLRHLGLADLGGLEPLRRVTALDVSENAVSSLGFVRHWEHLRVLAAGLNRIEDLEPTKDLLELQRLLVASNQVRSIEPLMFLANLIDVDLSENARLDSVLALQYLPNLKHLILRKTGVTNLEPLRDLRLITLDLTGNHVTSIAALQAMPLVSLYLDGTDVQDVAVVAGIGSIETLMLAETPVARFPAPPAEHALKMLSLRGTAVTDLCPALRYPRLEMLERPDGTRLNSRDPIRDLRGRCP